MKRIYINETEVESVAVDYTDLPRLSRRPYTYAKLRAYLKRSEGAVAACDRYRVISQIGGVDVEPVAFTFQIRDDGVHLFAPELLAELGAFAGPHGCCFELWAMIRDAQPVRAPAVSTGRIYYEGAGNIPGTISERELLHLFEAARPCDRWLAMHLLKNAITQQEQKRQPATTARVIQFPTASGQC